MDHLSHHCHWCLPLCTLPLLLCMPLHEQTLEKSARASSLARHISRALSHVSSCFLNSFSWSFFSLIPNTICSLIMESLRSSKLSSVRKLSNDSPCCCTRERKTSLSYVSFFCERQCSSNFFTTYLNLSLSLGWANTKVLNTSIAFVPAMVSSMSIHTDSHNV